MPLIGIPIKSILRPTMSYLKDFQTQISNRDYAAFLRLWEEYCESDELNPATRSSFAAYLNRLLP